MESKVIRAPETLTAQDRRAAMQTNEDHQSPGAHNRAIGSFAPGAGEDELGMARQDYDASCAHLLGELGEALVLRFLLINMKEFKLYLQNQPINLRMAAERWISQSFSNCVKSRIHADTADMLGILNDSELIEEWNSWKAELAPEKDAASNRMFASRRNAKSN